MLKSSKVKNIVRVVVIMAMSLLVCCKVSIQEILRRYELITLDSSSLMSEIIRKRNFEDVSKRVAFIQNSPFTETNSFASNKTILMPSEVNNYAHRRSLESFVHLPSKPFTPLLDKNIDINRESKKENILVVPLKIDDRENCIKKLKEVKDIQPIKNEAKKLKSTFRFIIETISVHIFNKYIDHMDRSVDDLIRETRVFSDLLNRSTSSDSDSLDPMFEYTFAYKMPIRMILLKKRYNYQELFSKLTSCEKRINIIPKKRKIVNDGGIYRVDGIDEIARIFNENTEEIDEQIRYSTGKYSRIYDMQELTREIVNDYVVCINILTNGGFPSLIKDALSEEKVTENGEENIKIRIKQKLVYSMWAKVEPWDFGLFMLLYSKIEKVYNFNGTIEELKEIGRENEKHILDKLENERNEVYRINTSYLPSLVDKYERKIKKLGELLEKVHKSVLEYGKYDDLQKREILREDEKNIRPYITRILASCIGSGSEERKIKYVNSNLMAITEKYAGFRELDQDILKKHKKKLIDGILGEFAFDEQNRNRYIYNAFIVRSSMQEVLDEIIDILVSNEVEEDTYSEYKLAKTEMYKNLKSSEWNTHISFIIEYLNKYYEEIIGDSFLYTVDRFASREDKKRRKSISVAIREAIKNQTIREWIESNILEGNMEEIDVLFRVVETIHKCRSMVNPQSEIWADPTYLTVDTIESNHENPQTSKTFRVSQI